MGAIDGKAFTRMAGEWLMPVLFAVGGAWADRRISIAGEHLVSYAVQRRLAGLFDARPTTTTGPRIAVTSCGVTATWWAATSHRVCAA